jgi:Ca-activated chloride channel family protein
MSEALRQFHFLQPLWLLGLLALPWLFWLGARGDASQRALSRLADPELLPYLITGKSRHTRVPSVLLALSWTLGVLALAGPTWSRVAEPMFNDRAAQVIALSLSRHMLARDVQPSRMDRARYEVHDLLMANQDGLNALIGYAGQSFVVAPLTSDAHSLDALLQAMSPDVMPVDGDNAAQAIEQGMKLIHDAKLSTGSLVLVTDDADAAAQAAARTALSSGVRVSVLGIGTAQGAPVSKEADGGFAHDDQGNIAIARRNDANLRALAAAGGGLYVAMTGNMEDVAALRSELHPAQHASEATGQEADVWQDRGPWLLLPLLLIAAVAFRRGWVLLLPLVLLPCMPTTANASGWRDWWQRPDQQAAAALRQGDAAKAQQLAQDPAWRGVAAYQAKDYAAAVQALQQAHGADAQYNLGNALAKLGRYPEAIKAYDHALQLDPHNTDAQTNRKLVQEAMRKQQQAPSPSRQRQSGGQSGRDNQQGQAGQSPGQQTGQDQQNGQQGQQQQPGKNERSEQAQNGQARQADAQSNGAQKNGSSLANAQQQPSQHMDRSSPDDASGQTPAPASSHEHEQAAKAQQGLQAQMDQALAGAQKKPASTIAHELGAVDSNDPLSKLPVDVRRDLQQVPDDPGALLRRKFELEYRERMGAQPIEGEQP